MTASTLKNPNLRFPEFKEDWGKMRIGDVTERISIPVDVDPSQLYTQIGVRSHGKGLFHKQPVTGKELGNKRVFWVKDRLLVVNIVFAWEQAVAKTTKNELGTIASHRFPMLRPRANLLDLDFLLFSFLTKRGKSLLELASPGGAGRNKTLGQQEFNRTKINLPCLKEQQKIAAFLSAVEERIAKLAKKKALLLKYKKGVMQQIFDQRIRFKDNNGKDFPDWEEKRLSQIATVVKRTLPKAEEVPIMTISGRRGFLNQEDRFSKVIAGESLDNYIALHKGELAYNRGNSKSAMYGSINVMMNDLALVPFVYHCFKVKKGVHPQFIEYSSSTDYVERQLRRVITSTARMNGLLNIGKGSFFETKFKIPCYQEQKKIISLAVVLNQKVEAVSQQLEKTRTFKKGLLQQMFV
jgi:type I restriction enzyme S subunit